ncbi:helix-turn-helix transcriptional regulator [Microbacterium awajiense]|uniref:Helix-turn-helix transcriptional regulator n=1 Tax=Microbacterium awajiense TaxID=415214 RepID=A0ABP7AHV1_9MICO
MGARVAEYLRARRAVVTPDSVGLAEGIGRRRVQGLRREEVALRAGVSPEYYVRIEQGRGIQPSHQVLRALASALDLDADATAYLYLLAREDAGEPVRDRRATGVGAAERASLEGLMGDLVGVPAFVVDRNQDVLAVNTMARIAGRGLLRAGDNLAEQIFSPEFRHAMTEWEVIADWSLAALRYYADAADGRFAEIVRSLEQLAPDDFPAMWARYEARTFSFVRVRESLAGFGAVDVQAQGLRIDGPSGLHVLVVRGLPLVSAKDARRSGSEREARQHSVVQPRRLAG